jgi:uncharacterized protein (TIGR01777 family)
MVFPQIGGTMSDGNIERGGVAEGPWRVAVTGASGLLGAALVSRLTAAGHSVLPLVRDRARAKSPAIYWDPERDALDAAALEGVDAVVHLAGESVAGGRWTAARRARILGSRTKGTTLLARALAGLREPPRVLVSASAVGYYGDTGDREVDEGAPRGDGFLAEVCEAWEAAAQPARDAGIRVVHPRFGVVLAAHGGALERLLPLFRLGVGGRVGSGQQGFPWVALDDVVAALVFALGDETLRGPVNVVAPARTSNAEFTRALASVLARPAFLPVPAFALRAAFGAMADEALLSGQFAVPRALEAHGFRFAYPALPGALRHLLRR